MYFLIWSVLDLISLYFLIWISCSEFNWVDLVVLSCYSCDFIRFLAYWPCLVTEKVGGRWSTWVCSLISLWIRFLHKSFYSCLFDALCMFLNVYLVVLSWFFVQFRKVSRVLTLLGYWESWGKAEELNFKLYFRFFFISLSIRFLHKSFYSFSFDLILN